MHRLRHAYLAAALLILSRPLAAQSPSITRKGDPSIRSDTIYALRVDPDKHPEENVALLLDDGVLRFESDGTGSRTYRMIGQLLRQQAVETWSEFTFGYNADREEFVLNWARVLSAEGKVLADKPIHVQEGDAPVAEQSPVYTNNKIVRVSLANVAPGTIVDYSYTTITKKPALRGDFSSHWRITTGGTVRRSRLILDVPASMPVNVHARNLNFEPHVRLVGGRKITTWSRADIPRLEPEMFAADSNDIEQVLDIGGAVTWTGIGEWFAGLTRNAFNPPADARTALADEYAEVTTRLDSLRALYRWVAQDVRYVSLSLGEGSYQPRAPQEVLATMSGDCKDKVALFIALARTLGYEAFPVLVASEAKVNLKVPAVNAFDHVVAAVKLNGAFTYLDVTADLVPFGKPIPGLLGEYGLLVRDDGRSEVVTLPDLSAEQSVARYRLTGTIDAQGRFKGHFSRRGTGLFEYQLRGEIPEVLTEKQMIETAAATAQQLIEGAVGDSLRLSRGFDLDIEPFVEIDLKADNTLKPAADGHLFYLPIGRYSSPQVVAQLERESNRVFPFDAAQVFGRATVEHELVLTIPDGWKASLPDGIVAESAFGRLETRFQQSGNVVTIQKRMRGTNAVLPKTAKDELLRWLRELGKDDAGFIILQPRQAAAAAASP